MHKNLKLVSVTVPIYNVEGYIEKCVRTLFEQTYQNIEYIFVDDCSPDNSVNILERVLEEYPHRKEQVHIVRHEINKGLAVARNTGLDLAKGDYVMFADSDDYTDVNWVKYLLEHIEKTKSDIVFCDHYVVRHDSILVEHYPTRKMSPLEHIKRMRTIGGMWTKIYKRTLFEDNGVRFPSGFDSMEDLRTNVQLYYFAKKVDGVSKPLYYYNRTRYESLTGLYDQKSLEIKTDVIENIKGIESFFIEKNIDTYLSIVLIHLKFGAKRKLLINAKSIKTLKLWKSIFPESNDIKYILKKAYIPIYYKMVAISAIYNIWIIPRIWFIIKRIFLFFKRKIINTIKQFNIKNRNNINL